MTRTGGQSSIRGNVALVTGASQGLGQYLAMALGEAGARVVLSARNRERLDNICQQITSRGGIALAVSADLRQPEDCERLIEETLATYGSIDIMVLNAGLATYGKLDELETFAPIKDAMEVNFFGAAYPVYLGIKHLISSKGLIAYVTSGAGHLPMAGYLGYTTSKHAMNGFFEALRLEMYPHGVDVLCINPGDMFSDDGAGRTVFGPDGSEHKVDLSIRRKNDIPRVPASAVAEKCLEAIVNRERELNLSPPIQKVATLFRPWIPDFIDHRIYGKAKKMRSAFDSLVNELRRESAE